jgi:capsular exopolysaccharide synthesis family protein
MSRNYELMHQTGTTLKPEVKDNWYVSPVRHVGKSHGQIQKKQHTGDDTAAREQSFRLVQNVFLPGMEEGPRVVVFAGVDSGVGCSLICAHVAETLAAQKLGSVCVVDANLRTPSLPDFFGVDNHFGLTDALSKTGPIRDFTRPVRSGNLSLLSCGAPMAEAPCLLNSEMMRLRMAELRKEFDYVLVDTPALGPYTDALVAGRLADGVVLVLEANSTRREAAARVTENLRAAQIKILGAVLNKRTFPIPEFIYRLA